MSVEANRRLVIKHIRNSTSDNVCFLSLHSVIKIKKVLMQPEIAQSVKNSAVNPRVHCVLSALPSMSGIWSFQGIKYGN